MTPAELKTTLYAHCQTYVGTRIATARQAMEAAQEAANTEEKSSAGDKYETGRAMAQLERDRHAALLADALKQQQELAHIDALKPCSTPLPGSLILTSRGNFFVAISAGKITLDGTDYFAVSPASPVAVVLKSGRVGDSVALNKQVYQIRAIY